MWSATIESKTFEKGFLQIGVSYTNGIETFSEPYQINTESDINVKIKSRLSQLNMLETMEIPLGPYLAIEETNTTDPKQYAIMNLRKAKDMVALGVFKDSDKEVLDAIQAVKEQL